MNNKELLDTLLWNPRIGKKTQISRLLAFSSSFFFSLSFPFKVLQFLKVTWVCKQLSMVQKFMHCYLRKQCFKFIVSDDSTWPIMYKESGAIWSVPYLFFIICWKLPQQANKLSAHVWAEMYFHSVKEMVLFQLQHWVTGICVCMCTFNQESQRFFWNDNSFY